MYLVMVRLDEDWPNSRIHILLFDAEGDISASRTAYTYLV